MSGDPRLCPTCDEPILGEPLVCDGICGNSYHPTCRPRSLRSGQSSTFTSQSSTFTCQTCAEIKPCHVLKAFLLINSALDAFSDKLSSLDHNFSSMRSELNSILTDREAVLTRLDNIQSEVEVVSAASSKVADTVHRNFSATARLEDNIMELNISPEVSSLKEDLASLNSSMSDCRVQLRTLAQLASVAHPPPTPQLPPVDKNPNLTQPPMTQVRLPKLPPQPLTSAVYTLDNRLADQLQPYNPSSAASTDTSIPDASSESHTNCRTNPSSGDSPSSNSLFNTPPPIPSQPSSYQTLNQDGPHDHPTLPSLFSVSPINWIPNASLESSSFYVGKCHILTTEEMIRAFIATELKIPISCIKCRKLTSPSRPLTDYSFVSFKVNLPSIHAQKALAHSWPSHTQFVLFQNKHRARRPDNTVSSPPKSPPKNANHPPERLVS